MMALLGSGLYLLWTNFPTAPKAYTEFATNISKNLPSKSYQFYPNMRYQEKRIGYYLETACDEKKRSDVERAFKILEDKTILEFYPSSSGKIRILCSDLAPEPENKDHFVAGEGGPTEIINTSEYSVILAGKISLYRPERCDIPIVALHEILHALGFDHTNDKKSVMYPVTECEQELDGYIINQINSLYSVDSEPDLVIEKVSAFSSGRYVSFNINISNYGLDDVENFSLFIMGDNQTIKEFPMEDLKMGERKTLNVQNTRVPRNLEKISFIVRMNKGNELSMENNIAELIPQL